MKNIVENVKFLKTRFVCCRFEVITYLPKKLLSTIIFDKYKYKIAAKFRELIFLILSQHTVYINCTKLLAVLCTYYTHKFIFSVYVELTLVRDLKELNFKNIYVSISKHSSPIVLTPLIPIIDKK